MLIPNFDVVYFIQLHCRKYSLTLFYNDSMAHLKLLITPVETTVELEDKRGWKTSEDCNMGF